MINVEKYKKYCIDRNGNPCLFDYHKYLEDQQLTHNQYDKQMMSYDLPRIISITKASLEDMKMDIDILLREEVSQ